MSALWKVSKYNYYCEDDEGNYLICNFYKGVDSFCKISKNNVKKFKHILDLKKIEANCEDAFLNVLYQKGFLIDDAIDELFRVKSLYFNTVMSDSLSLTIMPTEKCNFRCPYCYETFEKGKMTSADQRIVLKYIQKQLMFSNHLHISWFGGEPLLALDVIEYIMQNIQKICKAKKILFSSNITTNAYFLDEKTFDKLYQLKVTAYQITLDGLKEQHDRQRIMADGSGTYDKIIQNLISIKNLSKDKYKFARITIRVNITRDILDRIDEFIQFYKKIFGDDARFNIRFAITDDYGGEAVKKIKNELVSGNDIYTQLDSKGVYSDKTINFADALSAFQPMNLVCYAAYKSTYTIGSDLTLYRCGPVSRFSTK